MSLSSILETGNHALIANQVAISVVSSNIANVNTEGYCKQTAVFSSYSPSDTNIGSISTGVQVTEITRSFDRLLEDSYLARYTQQSRYETQATYLSSVEELFNESNRDGISSSLTEFFNSWQTVANFPDDLASKQALLSDAESLSGLITSTQNTLIKYQSELDTYIANDVDTANALIEAIAKLNLEIGSNTSPNSDPNTLLDERDQLVRELAAIINVEVVDNGGSDFTVKLETGQPLVEGGTTYSLELLSNEVEYLRESFTGTVNVSGTDSYEYTLEFINSDEFKVSLDGGKTWLTNDDGSLQTFEAPEVGQTVLVKDLELSFTTDDFGTGDIINIVPKTGLYWNSPTSGSENITPMVYSDGTDNTSRVTGGTLAGYFTTRDDNIGTYMDELDTFARALIWEVNSIHSEGATTNLQSTYNGSYSVSDTSVALGSATSGLTFGQNLTEGNLSVYIYDSAGNLEDSGSLDFDPDTPGEQNFDPSVHSLEDVVSAFNNAFDELSAQIVDGAIQITAKSGYSVAFGEDTAGLLAGLGINTFFDGDSASNISVRDELQNNVALVNSGQVNQAGVITSGDNSTALAIASLATTKVTISTAWETSTQTLSSYYSNIVATVGSDAATSTFYAEYNAALASDISSMIASVSGVSLDEEMIDLIKYQAAYTAAAKLVTTADEMFQTVLGIKQ